MFPRGRCTKRRGASEINSGDRGNIYILFSLVLFLYAVQFPALKVDEAVIKADYIRVIKVLCKTSGQKNRIFSTARPRAAIRRRPR